MTDEISSYPLTWPEGWKRTRTRERARFGNYTIAQAISFVLKELERMGAPSWNVIISTNLKRRIDGLPYSQQRNPDDPGVSVWWRRGEKSTHEVIALDQYDRIEHNLYAVAKTIEAMRGIRRWGGGEILERTFSGFQALPPPKSWREILGLCASDTLQDAEGQYRHLRSLLHPDHGGSEEDFIQLQRAIEQARKELSA